eukprot:gene25483-30766_t
MLQPQPSLKAVPSLSVLRGSDDDKPFSGADSWKSVFEKLKEQGVSAAKKLQDKEERAGMFADLKERVKVAFINGSKNLKEGELGKRGEAWFFAQLAMVTLVILGVPSVLTLLVKIGGVASIIASIYFLVGGLLELGKNLSPFPMPSSDNQLVTTGVYSIVRHPIYCGLILLCFGVSIYSDSATRLVATLALTLLLNQKASVEEGFLLMIHPQGFAEYMVETRSKLLPLLY